MEQKAQKLLDFYHWTEFSVKYIANILTLIADIGHIGKRMEEFFSLLDNSLGLQEETPFSKIVVNHSVPSSSIEWKISNENFLDQSAMTYDEIYNVIKTQTRNSEWAINAEKYAREIYNISQNFQHKDFRLDTTWRHVSFDEKLKALVPEKAVGINPKVILTTLVAESEYGKKTHRFFGGSKKVGELPFEEQLDIAVNQYIQYYYWGLYASGNMPELYDIQIQTGTGGSYTPANAAMYARGQYCTDDLSVFEEWQNIYLGGTFL